MALDKVVVGPDGAQEIVQMTPEEEAEIRAEWAANEAEAIAKAQALPDLLPYQFFAMLSISGKKAALDAFIASMPEPQKSIATAKLDYSLSFQRKNDLVLAAQQALGLTDDALNALWLQAAAIT